MRNGEGGARPAKLEDGMRDILDGSKLSHSAAAAMRLALVHPESTAVTCWSNGKASFLELYVEGARDGKRVYSGHILLCGFLKALEVFGTKILMGRDVPSSLANFISLLPRLSSEHRRGIGFISVLP
jgi:hypothetical protein